MLKSDPMEASLRSARRSRSCWRSGPYLKKPNFYGSQRAFDAGAPHDGHWLEQRADVLTLHCRIHGRMYRLDQLSNGNGQRYDDGMLTVRVDSAGAMKLDADSPPPHAPHVLDVGRYHAIATLLRGITDSTRVHAVNTPLLAAASQSR
jgi:putative selenate reductase